MSILYPKTYKEFDHHIKFRKSIMNRRCSIKRLCWSLFFNKNAALQVCNFIKKRLEHGCFFDNITKFLRTALLENICEPLVLRAFPFMSFERFPTWTDNNNIHRQWRKRFLQSKTKKKRNSKPHLDEKKLSFS